MMYESSMMMELTRSYLGDEFYLFNDQAVVKMPEEEFEFEAHFDNQYGQDPEGNFKTINFTWILMIRKTSVSKPLKAGYNQIYRQETY